MNYWEEYENRIEAEEKNPEELSINIFKIKSERKQVFDKPLARTGKIVAFSHFFPCFNFLVKKICEMVR